MAARALRYPIRAVARMTGLPLDTLRAWERRYAVVAPARGDRGRLYTDADVQRLKHLAALVDAGHAIGAIAGLSDAELARLAAAAGHETRPAVTAAIDLEPLLRALKQYELPAIDQLLTRHALLLPANQLIFAVVLPALREVGSRWESGAIRPAHEHLASAVIRSVLGGVLRTMPRVPDGPTVVLATVSGERHELGLLCAAVLASHAGCAVFYHGPDLPAADIVHAATYLEADILLLATTIPGAGVTEMGGLKKLRPAVEIWAGGPGRRSVRDAVGTRVREIDSLEDFARLVNRRDR